VCVATQYPRSLYTGRCGPAAAHPLRGFQQNVTEYNLSGPVIGVSDVHFYS